MCAETRSLVIIDLCCSTYSNKCPGTLEDACKVFYGVFVSTEMAADVRRETASELIKQFGSNLGDIMFAVRSSAAGMV